MQDFDPQAYGPVAAALIEPLRENELGPGTPNRSALPLLQALRPETLLEGCDICDENMAQGCCSALWLLHDYLDESHTISQSIKTSEGGYWHGVMHRREGDFSNSKYWFRQTGDHPIFALLAEAAVELAGASATAEKAPLVSGAGQWDPYAFVDLCQANVRAPADQAAYCQAVQAAEWRLLFDFCYRNALGN